MPGGIATCNTSPASLRRAVPAAKRQSCVRRLINLTEPAQLTYPPAWGTVPRNVAHQGFMLIEDIAQALSARCDGDRTLDRRLVHPADAVGPSDLALAMSDDVARIWNIRDSSAGRQSLRGKIDDINARLEAVEQAVKE